ncbi:MAG TPA: response regulator [Solimonas sp.]
MADARRQRNWLNDRSLRFKSFLILGGTFGLFAFTSTMFLLNQAEVERAQLISEHTNTVLIGTDDLLVQALQQQTGLRGFALTHDRGFLLPYEDGVHEFDTRLAELRKLTADNPEQQARLSHIESLMLRWRRESATPILEMARDPSRIAEIVAFFQTGRGKQLMDELRQTTREMIAVENNLLAERKARLQQRVDNLRYLAITLLIAGFVLTALFLFAVQRTLAAPMDRLTQLIARLTGGDLQLDVPHTERGDEIGAIARALERFRDASMLVQRREWIKTHTTAVGELLSRQTRYESFGNELLQYLCTHVGAGQGALFRARRRDSGLLQIGGYGYRERRGESRQVSEGLVLQCAESGQPLTLSPVPKDYVRIGSGTGEAPAHTVYLWPLQGIEGVSGVIELATFRSLTEPERELLGEVSQLAGLALEALGNGLRTRELLEETRAQAEELQASEEALRVQQEELRTANEALGNKNQTLEEQGQRLRASEEELRVQAEELRSANDALGEKSRVLNEFNERLLEFQKALERKNDDLEQASRYKSEFLANMSHELRTPLNSLLILAKDLLDNGAGNLNDDQVESARIIHDSGHSLLRLINDILDLSKIEAGRMDVSWEEVELDAVLGGVERSFRHVARERGLGLNIDKAPGLPAQIHSDGAKLGQILTNLVGNALKFTHDGSVTLSLARPAAEQVPAGRTAEDFVAITVADTGIGIPPEKLGRLFQAFEQGDGTTSRRYGGTGLGLSISRGLAHMLGGDIQVQSTAGAGSRFTVLLPVRGAEHAIVAPKATPAPTPTLQLTSPIPSPTAPATAASTVARETPQALPDDRAQIEPGDTTMLVIEDDLAFARILADMARRKQYRVLMATDGESGLQLATRYKPHGILLDVGLPGMDGWAVMERLKATPATRHIPVHFITATEDSQRGLAMGAVGFITKPATRESIESAFGRVLASSASSRRVLVLDDDGGARSAIRKLLADAPIEIIEADSTRAGLERLAAERIDCVVLDLGLPDASGFEFLEQAARRGPVPPVVVYSARELTREENLKLREYTDSIVIKGVQSPGRLLDEISLFLHAVRKPATQATVTAERPSDLAGRHVLIVDDDMRNVFALSKALRGQGLDVVVAQDGRKALSQLEMHPQIDWVLMDIMMPDMDGYEATREIRKRPEWRDLPVIAVTAKAMKGDREKCLEAGATDYLTKPIDMDRLLSMMRAWTRPRG